MGKAGPSPKSNHLKVLDGTRESRINRNEPIPTESQASDTLVPPVKLSDEAYDIWCRLVPDLHEKGVMTPWDVDQMVMYCEAVAAFNKNRALMGEKYTAKGAAGGVIKSPHWQIMRDAQAVATQIGKRYGLTPGDRAGMIVDDGKPKNLESGSERLLS